MFQVGLGTSNEIYYEIENEGGSTSFIDKQQFIKTLFNFDLTRSVLVCKLQLCTEFNFDLMRGNVRDSVSQDPVSNIY